ncbi:MAG: DNA primase small subunit PriS [Candidatus Bathyarchaeia archaeon]
MNKDEVDEFIRNKFAEYYRIQAPNIQPPLAIEKREFGFILFKERMMVRHKSFRNPVDLQQYLVLTVPSDAYFSAAYYERPEESMENKGWIGADLIFDIDADHIETRCKTEHDLWVCQSCGELGKGRQPDFCPRCGAQKFEERSWLCETCLEAAKIETMKLTDILQSDFGFSSDDISVCFSGHRGYHVHIESQIVQTLDQLARKEIVDYVMGTGLNPRLHGLDERGWKRTQIIVGPDLHDPGWRGRIARGVYDFLMDITPEQFENSHDIKKQVIDALIEYRNLILESWHKRGPWDAIKGLGIKTWEKIVARAIKCQAVNIDTVVTTDIHRLIRLPNTLHGKTGLKVTEISVKQLENFDPLSEAVAFKTGMLTVKVIEAHQFRIGNEVYGPYREQVLELPTAAAMLLLCKKAANIVR